MPMNLAALPDVIEPPRPPSDRIMRSAIMLALPTLSPEWLQGLPRFELATLYNGGDIRVLTQADMAGWSASMGMTAANYCRTPHNLVGG